MRKTVTKEIEVRVCDFCGKENVSLTKCIICGSEGCKKIMDTYDLGSPERFKSDRTKHWAYRVTIYRYADHTLSGKIIKQGRICSDCAKRNITLKDLLY